MDLLEFTNDLKTASKTRITKVMNRVMYQQGKDDGR